MDVAIAHGIDLVELGRIEELIERHGERFLGRVFTAEERRYADSNRARRVEKYAARFAAKEAVLKMIGTGWRGGVAWTDVEVVNDAAGKPVVSISGEVQRIAQEQGLGPIEISITHAGGLAIASAVAVRKV